MVNILPRYNVRVDYAPGGDRIWRPPSRPLAQPEMVSKGDVPASGLFTGLKQESFQLIDSVVRFSEDPLRHLMYMFNCDRARAHKVFVDALSHGHNDRFVGLHTYDHPDQTEQRVQAEWEKSLKRRYAIKALRNITQMLELQQTTETALTSDSLRSTESESRLKRLRSYREKLFRLKKFKPLSQRLVYIARRLPKTHTIRTTMLSYLRDRKRLLFSQYIRYLSSFVPK